MTNANLKSLDLHGETRDIARILVRDFILECYNSGIEKCVIIHGIGTGIIKKTVQEELKKSKFVVDFYIDFFNVGTTIVKIKGKV